MCQICFRCDHYTQDFRICKSVNIWLNFQLPSEHFFFWVGKWSLNNHPKRKKNSHDIKRQGTITELLWFFSPFVFFVGWLVGWLVGSVRFFIFVRLCLYIRLFVCLFVCLFVQLFLFVSLCIQSMFLWLLSLFVFSFVCWFLYCCSRVNTVILNYFLFALCFFSKCSKRSNTRLWQCLWWLWESSTTETYFCLGMNYSSLRLWTSCSCFLFLECPLFSWICW